ncbi:MAG: AbrB/MazE/SpoVT family DNA-binding domain-containing protein [Desulfobacterales bacterium]|nr:AbrB/MazE/SpoVT family DNA-binding domain-containing protein [Desulfobacterales bacterium]
MIATVTTKGQVTIPKAIRERMGIRPNDKVDFKIENGRVVMKALKTLLDLRGSVQAIPGASIQVEREAYRKRMSERKEAGT